MPRWVLLVTAGACALGAALLIAMAMWNQHRERQAVRQAIWPYDEQDPW